MSNQYYEENPLQSISTPLSHAQIAEAFKRSSDGGATIVLSKLGISDIGSVEAEELAHARQLGSQEPGSIVERLALGNNRLSALPSEFAYFTRLRYLNLKHNSFTAFPEVLTLISSLDTLDLSHNKIKHLPSIPGNLVRLRVLCLSRNKLTRLPQYITQFQDLEVFQIDRNPWEWPPIAVIEKLTSIEHENHGGDWLDDLYTWIETDGQQVKYDDSGYSEQTGWDHEALWQFPLRGGHADAGPTTHARSFSIDSDPSTSMTESLHGFDISENNVRVPSDHTGRSTPARTGLTNKVAVDTSYIQSPPIPEETFEADQMHSRAQSHVDAFLRPQHPFVLGKKSLPDLRTAHKEPPRSIPLLPERNNSRHFHADAAQVSSDSSFPSSRQDSSLFVAPPFSAKPAFYDDSQTLATSTVSAETFSYFRRSSSIVISNALPKPLSRLLESARNILFATGQLYHALEIYQEADEHLSPVVRKVLEPANVSLLYLIRSLDRFDDVSRKAIPSPSVCRRIVESCKDTVVAFRKGVVLITSQINLYAADARCMRWLILELYGISVELLTSWKAMVPEIKYLKPFLYGAIFSSNPLPASAEFDFPTISNHLSHEDISPVARLRSADSLHPTSGPGRMRTARRHAGSFSSKDVEIGKDLPSYDFLPSRTGGIALRTPMLRAPKRLMTLPMTTPPKSGQLPQSPNLLSLYSDLPAPTESGHHRNASQSSFSDSSSPESPSALMDSPITAVLSSEVFRAIQTAVDLTPTVCDQIEETLGNSMSSKHNVAECLESARTSAKKLSVDIFDMLEGDPEKIDGRALREDAHFFLKDISQLSNILKAQGNPRAISTTLQSNILKLTNCTEEFSILLHISSSALYTPASGSPTFSTGSALYDAYHQQLEDNQLASSFSRSRSALTSSKQLIPAHLDNFPSTLFVPVKPLNTRRLPVKEAFKSDPG